MHGEHIVERLCVYNSARDASTHDVLHVEEVRVQPSARWRCIRIISYTVPSSYEISYLVERGHFKREHSVCGQDIRVCHEGMYINVDEENILSEYYCYVLWSNPSDNRVSTMLIVQSMMEYKRAMYSP